MENNQFELYLQHVYLPVPRLVVNKPKKKSLDFHAYSQNKQEIKKEWRKVHTYKYICRKKTSRIIFKIQARKHFTTTFAKHLLIILMLKI